ncbi:pyridoxal phosphate-dependent aminotransferase [uncultured Draconibacterium sp.]|uniref:pyridoxal phosphate-dependent aminotransferase n=1 Tax=uncultured Draconibacterium sp. TaxID=1573823 RepID=UPI002AA70AF2|nr:pyridoxal phosphate-dependent aminotransferase [uncultured Draconibacterium sp.]
MIAQKVKEITPFIVMEVLEKAAEMEQQGINVIHLEVGEPDFSVPQCVSEAVQTAFNEGRTHYTHSLGDPELRKQIAEKYKEEYNVSVSPDQIIVTSGSSPAILLTLGVLCEADDEIIISDPGYACYANFIRFIGAKPINVPVYEEDGFQYRYEEIKKRITSRTRAIMINSPMNPTGNLLSLELMRDLVKFEIPIISDEIYHGLVYEKPAHSILEVTDKAFVLNGFSKRYAMTGLRLGYVIAPKDYVRCMQKVQQNLFICASSTAQRAGIEALRSAKTDVDKMRETYNKRRKYLIERLSGLGFEIKVKPTGAFYVFVNAKHLSSDSYKLAFDILEKAHVGVTPGIDFGPNGEGFLRFSYANSIENIKEGMDRLKVYLKKYHDLSID